MDRLIEVSIPEVLNPNGGKLRKYYIFFGELGRLFTNFHDPIAIPKGADNIHVIDKSDKYAVIYDNFIDDWIPLTDEMIENTAKTYTYAPKPITLEMELDYFVRSAGLIKHAFIWSGNMIPRDNFAKIRNQYNANFRGRYTFTPWLPQIHSLGVLDNNSLYHISLNDRLKIYNDEN